MSEKNQKTDVRHIYKQMKAVCSLIQPEYQAVFHKLTKILELQLLLQELAQENPRQFQASSISASEQTRTPCDLTTFIRTVAPTCNEAERSFLHTLQNTEQTIRMLDQVKQFQSFSKDTKPEDLMMQFMTPEQQKTFQQFNTAGFNFSGDNGFNNNFNDHNFINNSSDHFNTDNFNSNSSDNANNSNVNNSSDNFNSENLKNDSIFNPDHHFNRGSNSSQKMNPYPN